jgi:hypothetical protein
MFSYTDKKKTGNAKLRFSCSNHGTLRWEMEEKHSSSTVRRLETMLEKFIRGGVDGRTGIKRSEWVADVILKLRAGDKNASFSRPSTQIHCGFPLGLEKECSGPGSIS